MQQHSDYTSQKYSSLDVVEDSESDGSESENVCLSRKETRQIVTPYAFFVADDLLGTPLAGPFRRGFGLMIDLFFIFLLTQISSLILAAIAAWTFFRAGNRLNTKKRFNAVQTFLRLLVALLLFVVAMGIIDAINGNDDNDNDNDNDKLLKFESPESSTKINDDEGGVKLTALTAKYLLNTKAMKQQAAQKECEPIYDCFQTLGDELVMNIVDVGLDKATINDILKVNIGSVSESLSTTQQTDLTTHLQQISNNSLELKAAELKAAELKAAELKAAELKAAEQATTLLIKNNAKIQTSHSVFKEIIERLEKLMEELGLGLGWAAFYFSIFTAWSKGQTPGKKLLGMQVIKLDNTPLNLWESFGRYGGYAAGLATGLMGFLQVFWDPNRQAIQDKISETLVIDLRKPKVPFNKDMAV
jgi:hypothetical protein